MPGRFAGLAVLPLPDVDRALSELRYALDVLGLAGVVLLSNVLGRYPGDPDWAPLFDELEAREAYVLLHPTAPPYRAAGGRASRVGLRVPVRDHASGRELDLRRRRDRWPSIRLQVAHLGGTIPFLAERLGALVDPALARGFLRGLFYDTALVSGPLALAAACEHAGPSQVVLGSDWPYVDALDPGVTRYARNGTALLRAPASLAIAA